MNTISKFTCPECNGPTNDLYRCISKSCISGGEILTTDTVARMVSNEILRTLSFDELERISEKAPVQYPV